VGVVFLPADNADSRVQIDVAIAAQDLEVLAWRVVPVRPEVLAEIANPSRPEIWHVLISGTHAADLDRRLYLARKQFERSELPGYVASMSSSTMVYKALCAGRLLADFYPDLADPEFKTAFALFYQRYATNVLPSWSRAQPFRALAHNGEINTLWGNRGGMEARAATLPLDLHRGGSDSVFRRAEEADSQRMAAADRACAADRGRIYKAGRCPGALELCQLCCADR